MKSHIQLPPQAADYSRAIVCGSPERAEYFSRKLSSSRLVAKNREYHSYLGTYNGVPVLITSHGVGSAGAAICFNELIDAGAKKLIRIGTAGALQDDLGIADIVLPLAAVRCDGVSPLMVPTAFPAVPGIELLSRLREALASKPWKGREGIVVTTDLFYPGVLEQNLALYAKAGAVAVEMEISTLFIIGSLRKVETAALVVLDGNPLKWDQGNYDPRPEKLRDSMDRCFEAAVTALTAS